MYSVIDIGSNTIRLVIYKVKNGEVKNLISKKVSAGLAGYVEFEGELSFKGQQILVETLMDFKDILSNVQTKEDFIFATASLRNIKNCDTVLEHVKGVTGLEIEVISGEEEAVYDYYGAKKFIDQEEGLLIDIGGGSTELVLYKKNEIVEALSIPIGSLNLYNNYVKEIIPNKKEMEEIYEKIKKELKEIKIQDRKVKQMCCVGGSPRAILKYLQSRKKYKSLNNVYPVNYLKDISILMVEDREKLQNQILKITPDRIHTFIPGFIILKTIVEEFKVENIITSSDGVREGYIYRALEKRGEL